MTDFVRRTQQTNRPDADPDLERANVSSVCRHLALVAIDGATDELADTMAATFQLHLDGIQTDRTGYLALIEANHSAAWTRPPLDVVAANGVRDFVMATLHPQCVAYYRMVDGLIAELWMTTDWQRWRDQLMFDGAG